MFLICIRDLLKQTVPINLLKTNIKKKHEIMINYGNYFIFETKGFNRFRNLFIYLYSVA